MSYCTLDGEDALVAYKQRTVEDLVISAWARGYETEAVHEFWPNFLVPVFGFPLCIFYDDGSHSTDAEITTFFESHGTTQIRTSLINGLG